MDHLLVYYFFSFDEYMKEHRVDPMKQRIFQLILIHYYALA